VRSYPGTKCLGLRHPKEPSRRVRCDSRRCAHRFDDWSEEITNTAIRAQTVTEDDDEEDEDNTLTLVGRSLTVPLLL
jgi:hypothetical protein